VAFESNATNFPGGVTFGEKVYVKDLVTGEISLVSTSDTGTLGNGHSGLASLSPDGSKVAFVSEASNLDPGDTDSIPDVYVKDLGSGNLTLASASGAGQKGNDWSGSYGVWYDFEAPPSLSSDGGKVAFESDATNLVAGDNNLTTDIFVKDLQTGSVILASASSTGAEGDERSLSPSLSSDGMKVAFTSEAYNFVAPDSFITVFVEVYVKDLASGRITLASTSPSRGSENFYGISEHPSLSSTGDKVTFDSRHGWDAADTDSFDDVYVKAIPPPKAATFLSLFVAKRGATIDAIGGLRPAHPGRLVTVTLFRNGGAVITKRVTLAINSTYAVTLKRPGPGQCEIVVKFAGDSDHLKSSTRKLFSC
jgi:hypothetical protein